MNSAMSKRFARHLRALIAAYAFSTVTRLIGAFFIEKPKQLE
jgi:uncharacterized protein involved in cysteine biosynthesis